MPKFSIVIPVYNVAPCLRECLDSVLAQTFTNWEAICVDDGSTDGSSAILDEYDANDCRFHVIHLKNGGVSCARNTGIVVAAGEYVTFLDGDDLYERGWLAEARRILDESSVDLLRMKPALFADGKVPSFKCCHEYRTFRDDEVRLWGWKTYAKYGWAWVSFVRRSCLASLVEPFPVGMAFMEDNIFSLRLLKWCSSAVQSEYAGYGYRQRETSVCARRRPVASIERLFDEAMILLSKSRGADRVAIQGMLCSAVLGWRRSNLFARLSLDAMESRLRMAREHGVFDMTAIPCRWRLGFLFVMKFGYWNIMDFLILAQNGWGAIRGSLYGC